MTDPRIDAAVHEVLDTPGVLFDAKADAWYGIREDRLRAAFEHLLAALAPPPEEPAKEEDIDGWINDAKYKWATRDTPVVSDHALRKIVRDCLRLAGKRHAEEVAGAYCRGAEEGASEQAIIEVRGRERFLNEVKVRHGDALAAKNREIERLTKARAEMQTEAYEANTALAAKDAEIERLRARLDEAAAKMAHHVSAMDAAERDRDALREACIRVRQAWRERLSVSYHDDEANQLRAALGGEVKDE